jgi:hypothetical protein
MNDTIDREAKGTGTVVTVERHNQIVSSHVNKLFAFMAKYEGRTHREIAQRIGCSETTIATYFSRDWRQDYQYFADGEDKARLDIAHNVLKHNMVAAAETLVRLMNTSDPRIKLAAAKEILNRTVPPDYFFVAETAETITVQKLSVVQRTKRKTHL